MRSSQKFGAFPVGAVIECAVPPADGNWIPLDGRSLLRADYPSLSARYGVGTLTSTQRTLAAVPRAASICASPNYFVAAAAVGTTAIQYSADGASWSQTGVVTPNVGEGIGAVCWAGSRFVAGYIGGAGQPIVTTGDNPGSAWTVTTGGTASVAGPQGLAYSASLGLTVCIPSGASTSIYTLADGATAWVARTAPSADRYAVCWTGQRFVSVTVSSLAYHYSPDGGTWSTGFFPYRGSALSATPSIASNGAGLVVAQIHSAAGGAHLLVSADHGATWRELMLPAMPGISASPVWYSGGKFYIGNSYGVFVSTDGYNWVYQDYLLGFGWMVAFAQKGGVTAGVSPSGTTAVSATESATAFPIPLIVVNSAVTAGGGPTGPIVQPYIKAR